VVRKRNNKNPIPLIVEKHPADYDGYPFITLIQYDKNHFLTIIDNATNKTIKAYVLDLCGPENVNEERIVQAARIWFKEHKDQYPLSFELSRLGMASEAKKIYRTFHIEYVTRVIGPLPSLNMLSQPKVRRRRKKNISS